MVRTTTPEKQVQSLVESKLVNFSYWLTLGKFFTFGEMTDSKGIFGIKMTPQYFPFSIIVEDH